MSDRPQLNQTLVDDIRHFIFDRDLSDNVVDMDLLFSEPEIRNAMRHAAMSYNARPPTSIQINVNSTLPQHIWVHFGTSYHLLLAELFRLSKNDITYKAGGVTANLVKTRITNFRAIMDSAKKDFHQIVDDHKRGINIDDGYGAVG